MESTFGKNFKITIWGGSHESEIGVRIKGFPLGTKIDMDELQSFMNRRMPGNSPFATKRKEPDIPVPVNGISTADGASSGYCEIKKVCKTESKIPLHTCRPLRGEASQGTFFEAYGNIANDISYAIKNLSINESPHYRFSPSVRRFFKFSHYTLILSTMDPFLSIAPYTARGTRQQTAAMSTTATMTGIAGIMNSTPR